MDNGLSSLVAGKRRRDGYANDEDVKENLKASRQWYNGTQQKEPQNSNGHYKQHLSEASTSTPSLNMEQRVMAAAALQDLRGITESSKVFFQSQLQQQKYQQVMNSDAVTLGESLPPLPYIRTPPLHSEADAHNGSPSSSSSGPYTNMPVGQYNGVMHRSNEAPIQQQHESESSYSSLMHTSQSTLLAQNTPQPDRENALHSNGPLASYQRDDFPHGQVVQSVVQNGNVHQHPARTLVQNGVAFHHPLPGNGFQNGTLNGSLQQQQQQQVLPNVGNQLPHGDLQRLGSNVSHAQVRHGMASSSHHQQQQQMGLPMHQQGGIHRMQENTVQYQQMSQSNNLGPQQHQQQQPGHCNSNGPAATVAAHPSVQGCSSGFQHPEPGFSPLHGDFHQVPNSWYPSMRDSTTETQPSVSTSRLLLPPSVTDQRGLSLPSLPPQQHQQQQQQLSQVQGGFGEVQIPDQDHSSSSAVVANGALDDPALQRALMRPPPRLTRRSYTKVYKLGSITRAVDVNRFKNYTELRCGLAHMFNLEGQLDQKLGWQLIFTDNEDDLLLVGDDPWEEFVRNVRAIRILTPAEVFYYTNEDKWTAATYNSNGGSAPKLL